LLISIVLMIFTSCTIKKWDPPEWDVTLEIPVINETVYMHELEDSTENYIIRLDNDTLFFSTSEKIESKYVGDELKVDGQTEELEKEIGDELEIEGRDEVFNVSVGDRLNIDGQSEYFERSLDKIEVEETGNAYSQVKVLDFARSQVPGVGPIYNEPIPPIYNFPPLDTAFTVFENDNVEYAVIDSGFAYIDFTNNTEIPLSSTNPTYYMTLEIYSGIAPMKDDPIITYQIDHIIDPDATEQIELDLSGKHVFADNYLRVHLSTDGTNGQPIDVLEDDNFHVAFSVSEMLVSEASAMLPEESINHDEAISIEDAAQEISLVSAIIDSCEGNFYIDNQLPIDGQVTVEFMELFDDLGYPFKIVYNINASSPNNYPFDLSDFKIYSTGKDIIDSLHFSYKVRTDSTDDYVTITDDMSVATEVTLGEMKFEEVTGYLVQTFTQDDSLSLEDATDKILLQEANIRSGMMEIDISGLSFDPQISILFNELRDQNNNPVHITNADFPGYSFADHRVLLWEDQEVHYHVEVDMPNSELITVHKDDSVQADIHLSKLIFDSVIGKFNQFTIEDEKAAEVDSTGEYSLVYAEIDSCDVHVSIPPEHYTLPFGANIQVKFEEIFDAFGDTLIINLSCPGDTTFSFAEYSIGEDPFSTTPIDSLHYSYIVTTEPTAGYVTVNYEDEVLAEIELGEMKFNNIKGIIDHKRFEMDDIEEDLDIENLPDSIANILSFQNAELHLDVYNGTGFNCWLNIDMIGYNDEGDSAVISIDESSGVILPEQMNHIVITDGVSEMLSIVPTHVRATNPYAVIGNGVTIGEITKNDSISGSYTLETPFKFIINSHTVKLDSLNHLELDETTRDAIRDNLNGVLLNLTAENLLPFGSNLELWLAADSSEVWTNPELIIDSFYVAPATIDPVHHTSGEMVSSTIEILLDKQQGDFSVFENPDVYVGTKMHIVGTNGEVVIIRGSDNLHLFGYVSVDVHVQEQDGGNK